MGTARLLLGSIIGTIAGFLPSNTYILSIGLAEVLGLPLTWLIPVAFLASCCVSVSVGAVVGLVAARLRVLISALSVALGLALFAYLTLGLDGEFWVGMVAFFLGPFFVPFAALGAWFFSAPRFPRGTPRGPSDPV